MDSILSNLDASLFSPTRPHLTRSQKRDNQRRFRLESELGLNISATELRVLQEDDATLHHARSVADGTPTAGGGEEFFRRDGLLYRRYTPPGKDEDAAVEQLVLPIRCRPAVLHLAHDIRWQATSGRKRRPIEFCDLFIGQGYTATSKSTVEHARSARNRLPGNPLKSHSFHCRSWKSPLRGLLWTSTRSSSGKG